jgi:hypothetical protein
MSDKEILIHSFEQYAKGIASNLFGFNSMPAQAVINYVIKNAVDKYEPFIDLFVDKTGNINIDVLAEAARAEIKQRGGVTIGRIKFTDKDVDELVSTFKSHKKA